MRLVSVLAGGVHVVRGAGPGPRRFRAARQRGAADPAEGPSQVPRQRPAGTAVATRRGRRAAGRPQEAAEHRAAPDRRPRRRAG